MAVLNLEICPVTVICLNMLKVMLTLVATGQDLPGVRSMSTACLQLAP